MFFVKNASDEHLIKAMEHFMIPLRRGIPTVIMVREPIQWILSMHRVPYHLSELDGLPIETFVRTPLTTRGFYFTNILEMRTVNFGCYTSCRT